MCPGDQVMGGDMGRGTRKPMKPEDLDEWLVIAAGFIMFFV